MQSFTLIAFKSQDKSLSSVSRKLKSSGEGRSNIPGKSRIVDDIWLFTKNFKFQQQKIVSFWFCTNSGNITICSLFLYNNFQVNKLIYTTLWNNLSELNDILIFAEYCTRHLVKTHLFHPIPCFTYDTCTINKLWVIFVSLWYLEWSAQHVFTSHFISR